MAALAAGHAHTRSLTITIRDHELIAEDRDVVVATFVEHHQLTERTNTRRLTAVFDRDPSTPNGLAWRWVQETWTQADPAKPASDG